MTSRKIVELVRVPVKLISQCELAVRLKPAQSLVHVDLEKELHAGADEALGRGRLRGRVARYSILLGRNLPARAAATYAGIGLAA